MTTAARGSAAENVIETGRGCFSGGRIRRNGTLYCLVRQIWDQYPPPDARHAAKTDCRFIPNADPLQRREPRFPYLVVARMPRIDRSLGGKTKIDFQYSPCNLTQYENYVSGALRRSSVLCRTNRRQNIGRRLNDLKRWERNPNCPCEIELYKDSAPYSFLFRQRYADSSTGIVGGLVYHGTPDRSGCYCEPRIRGWEIHT